MMLHWMAASLLLVTLYHGKTVSYPNPVQELKIMSISRENNDDQTSTFCLDYLPEADAYALSAPQKDVMVTYNSTMKNENCVKFNVNMETWASLEDRVFSIHAEKGGNITAVAFDIIQHFPDLPLDKPKAACLGHDRIVDGKFILRLEGTSGGVILPKVDPKTFVLGGKVSYYVEIDSSIGNKLEMCIVTDSEDNILVCDGSTFDLQWGDATDQLGPSIQSAVLTIQDDPSEGIIQINLPKQQPQYEFIVTNKNLTKKQISDDPTAIKIERDATGFEIIDIRTVGIDANHNITETNKIIMHDRNLTLKKISDDVIEGSWMSYSYDIETKVYNMILDKDNGFLKEHNLQIDCGYMTEAHCYGYFIMEGVAKATHTVTVQPQYNGATVLTDQIQKIYKPVETMHPSLQIQSLQVARQNNKLEATICFSYITPIKQNLFSHYEVLLYNKKGQWLKHQVVAERSEGNLCIQPVTIDPKAFDVIDGAKVVVIQRGQDRVSVIASGEAQLS